MPNNLIMLTVAAATLGFVHTLLGPDHYIPFIMMARARRWRPAKTAWITFLCGLGHVGSSVLIGTLGIALGLSLSKVTGVESLRGGIAAWLIIFFGLGYGIWGLIRALKHPSHTHRHLHNGGSVHSHSHEHQKDHTHLHDDPNITPWILFTIFVLGPCEPLIPMLMYPAAQASITGVIVVALVFSIVTILTMLLLVLLVSMGITLIPLGRLERYTHALAGGIIMLSGLAIVLLGL